MTIDQNQFIGNLVADLKPTKPLRSPWVRTILWFSFLAVAMALVTDWAQEYRPNFWIQLNQFLRFNVELISGTALSFMTIYILFASSIPGEKINPSVYILCLLALLIFTGTILLSFQTASSESSLLGARPYCELEVLIYGGLALGGLIFLTRKGLTSSFSWENLLIGFSPGLISALIMQLACMYDPLHGLIFHYGPAIMLGLFGWFLSAKVNAYTDRKSKALLQS